MHNSDSNKRTYHHHKIKFFKNSKDQEPREILVCGWLVLVCSASARLSVDDGLSLNENKSLSQVSYYNYYSVEEFV